MDYRLSRILRYNLCLGESRCQGAASLLGKASTERVHIGVEADIGPRPTKHFWVEVHVRVAHLGY